MNGDGVGDVNGDGVGDVNGDGLMANGERFNLLFANNK